MTLFDIIILLAVIIALSWNVAQEMKINELSEDIKTIKRKIKPW